MFSPGKKKTQKKRKEMRFLKNERYFAFTVSGVFQKCGKNRGRESNRVGWSVNPNERE